MKHDRVYLMELVRARQIGVMSRREFLKRATVALGSVAAAQTLLGACTTATEESLPPVVAATEAPADTVTAPPTASEAVGLSAEPVSYPGGGETLSGYLARLDDSAARPAVIVIQEWWGLNEHIRDVARRFAAEGFIALAPDLYGGVVTTEPNEARKLAMELTTEAAVAEIGAALDYLRGRPFVTGGAGIVGFCMGGGLVLQTAARRDDVAAGVVFYGSPLSPAAAGTVRAPIQTHLGTADSISASAVEAMHAAFAEVGLAHELYLYDGAQHAFFNDTRASYDAEAAAAAWSRTLAWFRRYLGGAG